MADGFLAKLTILPYEDAASVQSGPPVGPPFVAQFNPESFTINDEIEYDAEPPPHGDVAGEAKFRSVKPRSFSFDFLLDGTGASGPKLEVLAMVELFRQTVGFSGRIHRPRFLVLHWGTFLATCVVESFSVNYKLFSPAGVPLRASVSASFREHQEETLKELVKNLSSPDVVHAHEVRRGEHLTLLVYRVYRDPRYYFQVASHPLNNLDNLRHVEPGTTLFLPPVA
jgi:hypothetical protein